MYDIEELWDDNSMDIRSKRILKHFIINIMRITTIYCIGSFLFNPK